MFTDLPNITESLSGRNKTSETQIYIGFLLLLLFLLVVQSPCCVWIFVTPWTAAPQAPLSSTFSQSLLKFTSIELVMLSNHLILCCPRLLLPSIFPSIRIFFNESALHIRWQNYWSSSFSINPFNEYSGLISFRTDLLDFLAVQGILKSSPAPQFKSINSLVLTLPYGPSVHDYWKSHSFAASSLSAKWCLYLF